MQGVAADVLDFKGETPLALAKRRGASHAHVVKLMTCGDDLSKSCQSRSDRDRKAKLTLYTALFRNPKHHLPTFLWILANTIVFDLIFFRYDIIGTRVHHLTPAWPHLDPTCPWTSATMTGWSGSLLVSCRIFSTRPAPPTPESKRASPCYARAHESS